MTFADLGIPFLLWEAPVECAPDYVGLQTCSLCQTGGRHCFRLNGSDDVMVSCANCQTENGLSANDKEDGASCIKCGCPLDFPPNVLGNAEEATIQVCYECLRAGRAAIPKDTVQDAEQVLITWESAAGGGLAPELRELLRTPGYLTCQGERWQFDEAKPMIYVGEWNRADFNRYAPNGDGKTLFYAIVPDTYDGQWDDLSDEQSSVYVFRSATREKWAAHWDMD